MIKPQTCPICEAELIPDAALQSPTFPFCSRRCRQVDLLRWSKGDYAIVEPLSDDQLNEHLLSEADAEPGYDDETAPEW